MSFGLQIFSDAGGLILDSTELESYYFYGTGTPSSYPSDGRVSVSSPIAAVNFRWDVNGNYVYAEAADYIDSAGAVHDAVITALSGSISGTVAAYGIDSSLVSFGTNAGAVPSFGMTIYNSAGAQVLPQTTVYASLLQSGSVEVAFSGATVFNGGSEYRTEYQPATIALARPLINQPLIFVTDASGGGVALYDFILTDGLYTGFRFATPLGETTTVSYVVVDLDPPATVGDFGIQVFDAGAMEIFSHTVQPLVVSYASSAARPYVAMNGTTANGDDTYSPDLSYANAVSHSCPSGSGVLLNGVRPYSGVQVSFYRYDPPSDPAPVYRVGFFGEFLSFASPGGVRAATVSARLSSVDQFNFWGGNGSVGVSPVSAASNPFSFVIGDF